MWRQGAAGERAVGARLDELAGEHVEVLHDRILRRADGRATRANIDHIAVAAGGVWVIDAKTHQGKLEVRRLGGLFTPRRDYLFIAGRDRTALIDGLRGQVESVRTVLGQADAELDVRGVLCFVGTELPWADKSVAGVPLVGRRGLAKLLRAPGDLAKEERVAVAAYLHRQLLPA